MIYHNLLFPIFGTKTSKLEQRAVRICIGSCRTRGELEQGMTIIRDILNGPGGGAPVIA